MMTYRETFQRELADLRQNPAFMAEGVVLEIMHALEGAMREQGVTRRETASAGETATCNDLREAAVVI